MSVRSSSRHPPIANGVTNPVLLGAAGLLEVDAFIVAGGAQAIGALAYGLPDAGLAPVDRIVGPGNAWVTAAKIEVCGEVGIDLPAGPSEGMVLAEPARRPTSRRGRPHHPGRARPGLAGDPRDDGRGLRRRRRDRGRRPARACRPSRRSSPTPSATTAGSSSPRTSTPRSPSSTPTRPSTSRSTSSRSSRRSRSLRNAGSLFVGPWAPESAGDYATGANHVLPTGGLARASGGLAVEAYGKFIQVQRIDREGLASHPRHGRDTGRDRGPPRPPRRRRDPLPGPRRMSPTPVTFASPTAPVGYCVGGDQRGGRGTLWRRPGNHRPVRPQHLPHSAGPRDPAAGGRPFRGATLRVPAIGLPTPDRSRRRPVRRHDRRDPRRRRRGRDPRPHRQGLPAGRRTAVVPIPTYAMYRVLTEQRGATVVAVPRRPAAAAWAMDLDADPGRRAHGTGRLAVQPEQPDRARGARRSHRHTAGRPRRGRDRRRPPGTDRRPRRGLRRVRRVVAARRSATTYPNLIVVRTASKAYALAGLRVGFAIARPEIIARHQSVPAAGVRLDRVGHARDRGAARPTASSRPTSRGSSASGRG